MPGYLRNPAEIYRRSFSIIRDEAALGGLPEDVAALAVRLIHASGMTDIVDDLIFDPTIVKAGRAALAAGAPVLCDARMVETGIIRGRLAAGNDVRCMLPEVDAEAACARGTTRSAAAVDLWLPYLEGAVVAIGNAPTALFRLLELLADGAPGPAALLAFPVGFVGAAEAKAALAGQSYGVPFITLLGRLGGSAFAAAAVNALAGGPA